MGETFCDPPHSAAAATAAASYSGGDITYQGKLLTHLPLMSEIYNVYELIMLFAVRLGRGGGQYKPLEIVLVKSYVPNVYRINVISPNLLP
jgi:hypothetical protein